MSPEIASSSKFRRVSSSKSVVICLTFKRMEYARLSWALMPPLKENDHVSQSSVLPSNSWTLMYLMSIFFRSALIPGGPPRLPDPLCCISVIA